MGKWLKRIAMALAALGLCLFLAVYFGGRWAAQHYLAREWKAGPGSFRMYAPRFRWSLDLDADSARYLSPNLEIRTAGVRLSADLFGSLLHFHPSARLRVNGVFIRLRPKADTGAHPRPDSAQARSDSLPFPVFKIPASASVRIGRLVVRDTAADSLAPLLEAEGLALRTRGKKAVALKVDALKARATGGLVHRLRAGADWSGPDSLAVTVVWGRGRDSASVEGRLAKANLLRMRAHARARIASSRPYALALGLAASLPRIEAMALDADAGRGRELTAQVKLDLRAVGLPKNLPLALPDQAVSARFDYSGRAGSWSLRGSGGGTDTDLRGALAVAAGAAEGDSLADPAFLARNAQVTLRGRMRGFRATVGGKTLPADLDVEDARLSATSVKAALLTGDSSRLQVDLRRSAAAARVAGPARSRASGAAPKTSQRAARRTGPGKRSNLHATPSLPPWNGTFSLGLAPSEAWMLAFTDTNVAFTQARLSGEVRDGAADAILEARALRAYGVSADSLHAVLRYAGGTFTLAPSRLWRAGAAWDLSGRVEPGRPGPPAAMRLANAEFGSLEAAQSGPGKLELHVRNLAPDHLPYRGLDSLAAFAPRLSADFIWDRKGRTGSALLNAEGRYRKDAATAALRAEWDAERLDLKEARASLGGNALSASGRVRLHGRQFYELKGLVPDDLENVSLRADRFDLAKVLAAFVPQPPLRAGLLDGDLGFAAGRGFRGKWSAKGLEFAEAKPFVIREASVTGRGDTLLVRVATASDAEPLFRDTVAAAVSGLLGKEQALSVRARAGGNIALAFDGGLTGFRDLRGRFSLRGGATLPGNAGSVSDVHLQADVALPLKSGLEGLQVNADTLLATYVVPGLDTQAIAASVRMREGKVEVPSLTLTGRDGAQLRGRLEFDPAGSRLNADLSGARLSAQFGGDKFQLRELAARVEMDSTQALVQAAVGSGSFEHVQSALRATGDFSRVTAYYRTPLGAKAKRPGGGIPLLRLSAVLDSSDVHYRIGTTVQSLMNIFRKQGQRKAVARRAKPMQMEINVETSGRGNSVETDVVRLTYVGNVSMVGTYPYALLRGRLTSTSGGIGTKKQAYAIKSMDIKWLNVPFEEGELDLNAEKRLARSCSPNVTDSCSIRMNLSGPLTDIKFAYDSDCRGGFGSGGTDVAAMVFSVQRGCYSPSASSGAGGLSYQEQALGLLDPFASGFLSDKVGQLSGNWIQSVQVTGIGALAQERKSAKADSSGASDTSGQAVGVEILSKEFWRMRFRAKSAYTLQYANQFNPWSYRVGVEWRPPLFRLVQDPLWRDRLKNHVTVDASVYTDPSHSAQTDNQDALRRRLGLNYDYDWWGFWWAKRPAAPKPPAAAPAADTASKGDALKSPGAAR